VVLASRKPGIVFQLVYQKIISNAGIVFAFKRTAVAGKNFVTAVN